MLYSVLLSFLYYYYIFCVYCWTSNFSVWWTFDKIFQQFINRIHFSRFFFFSLLERVAFFTSVYIMLDKWILNVNFWAMLAIWNHHRNITVVILKTKEKYLNNSTVALCAAQRNTTKASNDSSGSRCIFQLYQS